MKYRRKDKYKTEAEKIAEVQQDGVLIWTILNPSVEVQLAAVKQNGLAIQYIHNPSEAVQIAAVRENIYAFVFIQTPSEAVIEYIKTNNPEIFNQYFEEIEG